MEPFGVPFLFEGATCVDLVRTAIYLEATVKVLKISLAIAVGLYLVALIVFFVSQRSLLYFPSHSSIPLSEANANSAFRNFSAQSHDGIALNAWYAPATTRQFTIVFFHGNADSLFTAEHVGDPYIAAGYGFLLAEYRGYSGLRGSPTEAGLYSDGRAYIRQLIAQGVPSQNIILFGHSLGTGVATQMAKEFHVAGVMLLAPYLSIPKLAQRDFPFFPSEYLALDRFENYKKMKNIHVPVLIVNGSEDQVVPPSHGNKLYEMANEPREFHSIPNRGHNDAFDDFAPLAIGWMSRECPKN
jgi:fermentation-respiration switch protein FrsA (DUF1100 family)